MEKKIIIISLLNIRIFFIKAKFVLVIELYNYLL